MNHSFKTMSSQKSWDWATPIYVYNQLNEEFGFNFDPCPLKAVPDHKSSPITQSWENRRVFCNPPYGPEIPRFLAHATEAELAVFLLPARTDTKWFHEICLPLAKEIRFIKGRLYFNGGEGRAPFASMVVVFSQEILPAASAFGYPSAIMP